VIRAVPFSLTFLPLCDPLDLNSLSNQISRLMKLGTFNPSKRASILLIATLAVLVSAPSLGAAVLRTLAYHQITQFTNNFIYYGGRTVVLSADGRKIGSPSLLLISDEQSCLLGEFRRHDLKLVDMWQGGGGASGYQRRRLQDSVLGRGLARLVNADGSNPHQVIQVTDGYLDFRLSPDGTQCFCPTAVHSTRCLTRGSANRGCMR